MTNKVLCALSLMVLSSQATTAEVVNYDASSGLLPDSVGWLTFDTPSSTAMASVSGGILSVTTTEYDSTLDWVFDFTSQSSYEDGIFIESTAKILSESHIRNDRGVRFGGIRFGNEVTDAANFMDVWAHENQLVFVNGYAEITETYPFDTTDGFHTYRLEMVPNAFRFFIDSELAVDGSLDDFPLSETENSFVARGIAFGAGSTMTKSSSEWTTVKIGSLPAAIPEPSSALVLSSVCIGCAFVRRRRRR